ncbi:transposase [Fundidesulfovibrio terrae]|uniref:transposase n=1 Tax=Fundidesulfovibrio terrae TaxID=2922866 RepID=UPI001FAF03DE|nr:transposase [Fundidesulfovibrio terrae]
MDAPITDAEESQAREQIASLCRDIGGDGCPRCRGEKVYRLGSGRMRCKACGYTFHELTGRFMGVGGLGCAQWLRLIRLFADEIAVKECAQAMGVAYNTVYKAYDALRQAIVCRAIDAGQIRQALKDQAAGARPPVFGIMARGDWVFVDLVPDVDAADLTIFKMHFRLKTSRVGSVVYTGPIRGYLGLVSCGGPQWLTPALKARDSALPLDEDGGFWPYLKSRLERLQGVSAEKFPLYLKELEYRWNHRGQDLAGLLARVGLGFMPQNGEACCRS